MVIAHFNDIVDVNVNVKRRWHRWSSTWRLHMIIGIIVSTSSKIINTAIVSTLQTALSEWLAWLVPTAPHAPTNVYISTIATIFRCHISIMSNASSTCSMRSYAILRWNKFNVLRISMKYEMDFIVFRKRYDSEVEFKDKYFWHLQNCKLFKDKENTYNQEVQIWHYTL